MFYIVLVLKVGVIKAIFVHHAVILLSHQLLPATTVYIPIVQLRSARFGFHPFLVHTDLILPTGARLASQL